MSKDWLARYLLPFTGLSLTLLLCLIFFYVPRTLFKGLTEVGFKEPPLLLQIGLHPFALSAGVLCVCALFLGGAFSRTDAWRAIWNAAGFTALTVFAIFWTAFCAWLMNLVQTAELLRTMPR